MTEDHLTEDPLVAQRVGKVDEMRTRGADPYPSRFERSATAREVVDAHRNLAPGSATGDVVSVAGRLVNIRRLGKLSFGVLQDVSGQIQLFIDRRTMGDEGFERFDTDIDGGDWVGATGEVITTKRGELSVKTSEIVLLSKALRPPPEKWHGLQDKERRFRQRYLDLLANDDARRVAQVRIDVIAALRRAFTDRGFVEVETPMLQTEAGGALARPFTTHHNALDIDLYLRIATELHLKRLVIGGMERVFELGRVFRNEGIDATHNPEFTTLEAYQAFADYRDIMELMEGVIPEVSVAATGATIVEYQGHTVDLTPPYRRVPLLDLVADATGTPVSFDVPRGDLADLCLSRGISPHPAWGKGKLIAELFERLVEPELIEPTFVIDYPKEVSPLARVHPDNPELTERFELFAGGMELCPAFSELTDPIDQRRRFEAQARAKAEGEEETHPVDEDFLRALEHGMPPTGGLGIGVDRLVMLLADEPTIREVVLFPTMRPEA
jgi:lysyl-tRNA synthetase, class II